MAAPQLLFLSFREIMHMVAELAAWDVEMVHALAGYPLHS